MRIWGGFQGCKLGRWNDLEGIGFTICQAILKLYTDLPHRPSQRIIFEAPQKRGPQAVRDFGCRHSHCVDGATPLPLTLLVHVFTSFPSARFTFRIFSRLHTLVESCCAVHRHRRCIEVPGIKRRVEGVRGQRGNNLSPITLKFDVCQANAVCSPVSSFMKYPNTITPVYLHCNSTCHLPLQ